MGEGERDKRKEKKRTGKQNRDLSRAWSYNPLPTVLDCTR